MSRKVFTAGEVLAAADVNSFLMDQTVMSFAGTAARGSAIPSPVEGMYTHLEDSDRLQFWNGSAWRSPHGLTLLSTFTMNATNVDVTNVFTSEFDNYRIIFSNAKTLTGATDIRMRLLSGATPSTSSYQYAGWSSSQSSGSLTAISSSGAATLWLLGQFPVDGRSTIIDITEPNLARFTCLFVTNASGNTSVGINGLHATSSAYDGFRLFADGGGTITGTARIYGYRNA